MREAASAQSINHSGQFPSVTVSFTPSPAWRWATPVIMVQETARRVLPATMTASFEGTAQAFQSSRQEFDAAADHRGSSGLHRARRSL